MNKKDLINQLKQVVIELERSNKQKVSLSINDGYDNFEAKGVYLNEYDNGFDLEVVIEDAVIIEDNVFEKD